ncbi:hypothetical protein EVAR_24881_1 [Eumeta japonica]|uniref:Uncharacterized protein n=1 Tax=Eumeta variegata TaxID=151549 RepID=A0A4C1V6S6_EUMVA|nr:hypothetical protein EVAR_24881_1 [Eumeta japonica]
MSIRRHARAHSECQYGGRHGEEVGPFTASDSTRPEPARRPCRGKRRLPDMQFTILRKLFLANIKLLMLRRPEKTSIEKWAVCRRDAFGDKLSRTKQNLVMTFSRRPQTQIFLSQVRRCSAVVFLRARNPVCGPYAAN